GGGGGGPREVAGLSGQRRAAPAVLLRQVDAGIARLEQLALPRLVVRAARLPVRVLAGRGALRGHRAREPRAQLFAEGLVGGGVTEIHGAPGSGGTAWSGRSRVRTGAIGDATR